MATPDDSIYSLAEPTSVDIAAIERELEELWRSAAKGDEVDSVTRATAFNLIYETDTEDDQAANMLAKLTIEHPSRSILLMIGSPDGAPVQNAWVTAYCHRPSPSAPQICSEFISLESTGVSPVHISSTLRALLVCGLPTAMIVSDRIPLSRSVIADLAGEIRRFVCSHVLERGESGASATLSAIMQSVGDRVSVTSLSWARIRPWMNRFASALDPHLGDLARMDLIEISLAGDDLFEECLLFAAWCSARLEWRFFSCKVQANSADVLFDGNRRIRVNRADAQGVQITVRARQETIVNVQVYSGYSPEDDPVRLLSGELKIWGKDLQFFEASQRLDCWLRGSPS